MRTYQQQKNYERLEQLPLQQLEPISQALKQLWQAFVDVWQLPAKEPQVRQKIDRSGRVYWEVYDPLQDCMLRFDDEEYVMIWLEEQHHRQYRRLWSLG